MNSTAGNALFVLRMVLQRQAASITSTTRFSTAVIDRESADRKTSAWSDHSLFPGLKALASRSTSDQEAGPVDFLETESNEYENISTVLPSRDLAPRPIPWPTIFAHPHPDSTLTTQTQYRPIARLCDPVARLVGEGDLVSAQKIYQELRSHQAPIQHRAVYLDAATRSLEAGDTEDFLFWLDLYPNRPATRNHPELKAKWAPLTSMILTRYATDLDLLESYLMKGARKGLLPAIIRPMMQHLTFVVDADRSRTILENVFNTYLAHTTPKETEGLSGQGQRHLAIAQGQVEEWWTVYQKMCTAQGWLSVEEERAVELNAKQGAIRDSTSSSSTKRRDLIASAIERPPSARELAGLVWDVYCGTPDKVEALRQAFIHPSDHKVSATDLKLSSATRQILWTRAVMIMYARVKDHQKVIQAYQDDFSWYGLPDHPLKTKEVDSRADRVSIYPRKTIITTLMPSLLATIDADQLVAFHRQYLSTSTSLPPALRPDGYIHNTFISEISHRISLEAGMSAIEQIVSHGYDPGSQTMTTILLVHARKRMIPEMFDLLEAMESRDQFGSSTGENMGRVIPPPTVETYDWLIRILRNSDPQAAAILKEMKGMYFGEDRDMDRGERELEASTG